MNNSIGRTNETIRRSDSIKNTSDNFYINQLKNLSLGPPGKQRHDVAILDDNGFFHVGTLLTLRMRNVQHHLGSNFRGAIVRLQDGRYTAVRNYWDCLNPAAFYLGQITAINNTHKSNYEPKLRTIHHYDSKGNNVIMAVTQLTPIAEVQNYPDKGSDEKFKGVIVRFKVGAQFKGGGHSVYYLAISSDKFKESPCQRFKRKQLYLKQIKQHPDFKPTKREILSDKTLPDYLICSSGVAVQPCNGPNNPRGQPAKFENVTQCTPMCIVWNSSEKSHKAKKFVGAIVQLDNGCYRAVPESEFMVKVPCWAKHGVQDTSKLCLTLRLTGTIKLYGGDSGHKLISWCQTRKEWEWVPLGRIGEDAFDQTFEKRTRQAPSRLSQTQTQHGKDSVTTSCPRPLCVKNEKAELFMQLLHEKYSFGKGQGQIRAQELVAMETIEEGPKVAELPDVKEIIEGTKNAYEEHQKKLGKKKNASTSNRTTLNIATLDLSVMFEIIKGDVKGSLGDEVNKALGIKPEDKQDCHLYMNAMQSIAILPGPQKKKKKVCRIEGCTNYVKMGKISKYGTCFRHCPDNELKRSTLAMNKLYNKKQRMTPPMCSGCGSRRVPNCKHKRCYVCK